MMTVEADLSNLNDEDYLAARSRRARGQDASVAKCWLITSCLMYQNNFQILFEAYMFEKDRKNVEESAKHLKRLFLHFSKEASLWTEIEAMVDSLQDDEESDENFLCQIFEALPEEVQRKLLQEVATRTSDPLERSRLALLSFEKFPELMTGQGSETISFLIARCKSSHFGGGSPDPKQNSRERTEDLLHMLVMEICPKLLPESRLKLDVPLLHDIIMFTLNYATIVISNLQQLNTDRQREEDLLSTTWKTIITNLEEIGERMGWSLTEDLLTTVLTDHDKIAAKIISFQQENSRQLIRHYDHQSEVFYVVSTLFLKGLSEYSQERWLEAASGDRIPSILVEAFVSHSEDSVPLHQIKRRKTTDDERRWPLVTDGLSKDRKSPLVSGFLNAFQFFDIIRSDPQLDGKFQQLKPMLGEALTSFCIDVALYQGHFRDSLHLLRQMPTPANKLNKCRLNIKLASIHFCLGDHQSVADHIVQAVTCLSLPGNEDEIQILEEKQVVVPNAANPEEVRTGTVLCHPTVRPRHVHFLATNRQSILSYVTRLLIHILKDGSLQHSSSSNDMAIGHVIILLQYSYPEEKDLLFALLHKIRAKESFSYNIFCHYVINVDFLEEFAYVLADTSANVALDITPAIASHRRMGTRGANRGEKHEIQKALRRQVSRCYEDIDQIIIDFLTKHRGAIFQCLI